MAGERGAVFIGPADEDWPAGDWVPVGTCGPLPPFEFPTELAMDLPRFSTEESVTVTIPVDGEAILKVFREAAAQAVAARDAASVPYVQDAHLPAGQILVLGPALTGHDRDVIVIPTGERGDRVLDGIHANGGDPVPWTPTPAETASALPALTFGSPPTVTPRPDYWMYSGA